MEHDKLQIIESRAETLLSELKEDDHSFIYSTALLVMVALYLLAIIFLYIKSGFSTKLLIYLVALIGMLAYYKMNMNRIFSESSELLNYKKINTDDKVNYVSGMLKYLSSGFEVKLTRIQSVRWIYTILFPLFLLIIREIYMGEYSSMTFFINLIIAAFLGLLWYVFFGYSQKDLLLDRVEIDELIQKIYS